MNIPGFSQESLNAVREMLYAEAGQPPAEPCPPKQPPQPKPPPQPAPPPQPQSIPATQTDQKTQQQEQKLKKPKCIPQPTGQQNAVNHSETFDFTRCVRPDGTAYGTGGKCRKGAEEAVYTVRSEEKTLGLMEKLRNKLSGKKIDLGEHENEKELRAFADHLVSTLPKEFKLFFDSDEGVQLVKKTKSGDEVQVIYSPSNGFHFRVNGTAEAGSVKDRRAQIEIAMSVRDAYNSVVKALPVGAVIQTVAYDGDDKGPSRESAYIRMGFSRPEKSGGHMYSIKQEGNRMAPASPEQYSSQRKQSGSLWFAEDGGEAEANATALWYIAIFGALPGSL